jgi:hypothetical protein
VFFSSFSKIAGVKDNFASEQREGCWERFTVFYIKHPDVFVSYVSCRNY